jgi:hypothetical protein
MSKRAVVMMLASLCGVTTIMIGALAPASGDEGVRVRFTDTSGITTEADFAAAYSADLSRCTFNNVGNVASPCVVPVTPVAAAPPYPGAFDDTLSGDLQGTGSFTGSAVLGAFNDIPTLDFPFEAYEPFSVTVGRCGTGTFILHNQGNLNSLTGVWQIVPGSGRGGLTGISGNGTYSSAAPFTPSSYIGHIRCAKK